MFIFGIALVLVFGADVDIHAAESKRISRPLPINIDGQPVLSSLYMSAETLDIEMPLDDFLLQEPDTNPERAFGIFLKGLHDGNVEGLDSALKVGRDHASQFLDYYRSMTAGTERLKVARNLRLGSSSLFVWQIERQGKPAWPLGTWVDSQAKVSLVSTAQPLHLALVKAFGHPHEGTFEASSIDHLKSHHPNDHPEVSLSFHGERLSVDLLGSQEPESRVLSYWRKALMALGSGEVDSYLGFHSLESQEMLRVWMSETHGGVERFRHYELLPKHVFFLLDADPVFVVFYYEHYRDDVSTDFDDRIAKLKFLLKDADTNQLTIVNIGYIGLFHDLFGAHGLGGGTVGGLKAFFNQVN